MKVWKITIIALGFWLLSPTNAHATGILFQDNFNEDSLHNWQVERNQQWANTSLPCMNNGVAANWQILNGQLGFVSDGPSCITDIIPKQLDLSQIHNYQYDFDITMSETTYADRGFIFQWQDPKTWYGFQLFDAIVILHTSVKGEYRVVENSLRYWFNPRQKYHFTITVKDDSRFILKIDNQLILDINDYPHTIPGFKTVGFEASNGTVPRSVTFFDNIVVRSLDPGIDLNIPKIMQTDSQWQNQEYDSASTWAKNPSIGRWGCSLTSMVMILRYYNINFLPDGTYLNPDSLNNWLKSQVDGYIGEGNLNWLAVTRLTRLIHSRYGTPKLEFRRFFNDLSIAKTQIEAQQPVILKIDGHFLVADGVTPDEQDLLVKDPAFSYTKFSEYQQPPKAIETFTPSYTDLSYLLVANPPGVKMRLLSEAGEPVTEFDETIENIQEFTGQEAQSGQRSRSLVTHVLPKPIDQTYVLEITSTLPNVFPISIFAYDRQGNSTDLSQKTFLNTEPKYFLLHYAKDSSSKAEKVISFSTLRQDLEIGKSLLAFSSYSAWNKLYEIAHLAEFSGRVRQERYLLFFDFLLNNYSDVLTSDLILTLRNDLEDLSKQLNVIISR